MRTLARVSCRTSVALAAAVGLGVPGTALGQWTQWGGENRDFVLEARTLRTDWSEAAPKLLWKRALGDGESSVLVDGRVLYTMYRDDGSEVVVALKRDSGKTLWEYRYEAPLPAGLYIEGGKGPHATPLIADDRICSVGIGGKLYCLSKKTGELLWGQ